MKTFRLALAALALCAVAAPSFAQELSGTLKKVRDTKTFTIGHREASFPFAYYDDARKSLSASLSSFARVSVRRYARKFQSAGDRRSNICR